MATQRIEPSANIQPTPTAEDPVAAAQGAKARQMASGFASVEQASSQIGQIATNYLRDQALKQAQEEAAGIVKYDEKGNLIVPTNFDAPIGGGLLYSQAYAEAAQANYKHAAVKEFENKSVELQTQFPTDPESYSAKLIEYREAKINAMPSAIQPMMRAHFETIRAQGATSIAATRQRIVNETNLKNANEAQEQWVTDWAAFKQSEASGNFAPGDYEGHKNKLEDRWKDIAAMQRQAGLPDVAIQRYRKLAETQAEARNFFGKIGEQIGRSGESASVVFGANQEAIRKFEEAHPGQEAQAIIAGERQRAIARGQAQASATTSSQDIQYNNSRASVDTINAEWRERRREITSNPADYPDQQQALHDLNVEMQGRLNDVNRQAQTSNMRPIQKATTALATVNARDEGIQRAMSTAVATQVNTVLDVTAPQWAKASALADLSTSLKSPDFIAYSLQSPQGAALYRSVQQTVGEAHIMGAMASIGGFVEQMSNGRVSPEREQEVLAEARREGWFGTTVPGQIHPRDAQHLIATNRALYAKRQQNLSDATVMIDNVARGGIPTETQAKAYQQINPFAIESYDAATGQTKAVPPDMSNPAHVQRALAYINKSLIVPEVAREYMERAPGTASPQERAQMLAFGQAIQKTFDNHFKSSNITIDERKELVAAQMRAQLGKGYDAMNAIAHLGPDATPASINQYMSSESRKRENPDKPDETRQQVRDELTGVSSMATASPIRQGVVMAADWAADTFFPDDSRPKWGMLSDAATQKVLSGVIARSNLVGGGIQSGATLQVAPEVESSIFGWAQKFKDSMGKSIVEQEGLNPTRQAILDYFHRNSDDLAIRETRDADGNNPKYAIERKPFHLEANKAAGTQLTSGQWNDLVTARVFHSRPDLFEGSDPINPKSVRVHAAQRDDGTMMYGVYGETMRGNATRYIGDIEPNDPGIGHVRAKISDAVYREVGDSTTAQMLSNMPLFGSMIERGIAENIKESLIRQESHRYLPSKTWANIIVGIREAIGQSEHQGPLAQFTRPEYDEFWKKAATEEGQRSISRYGGLGYLLGFRSSPVIFSASPQVPDNAPDVGPTIGGAIVNASEKQRQGMSDSAAALEQARNRNRGSRKPE